jgi:DNA-binding NarL/FixJ family response regulator
MQYAAASGSVSAFNIQHDVLPCRDKLILICKNNLERECLHQGLVMSGLRLNVAGYEASGSIEPAGNRDGAAILMLHIGAQKVTDCEAAKTIRNILADWAPIPVLLLAENEDWTQILFAIELGISGYIPSSVGIKICVEAVHLALAGGVFVPAKNLTGIRQTSQDVPVRYGGKFTTRELQVIEWLILGKANKSIAYELNMSEATVKVHVHHIMKKFGASNRTEVIYKINNI